MTVSDFQVSSVIRTYLKNMKSRAGGVGEKIRCQSLPEDRVTISDQGMKKMLFERIGEKMTERLKRHDQEE